MSIEVTHNKISAKISLVKCILESLKVLSSMFASKFIDKKTIDCFRINLLANDIEEMEAQYNMAIVSILVTYHEHMKKEKDPIAAHTDEYNNIILTENYVSEIDEYLNKCKNVYETMILTVDKYKEKYIESEKNKKQQKTRGRKKITKIIMDQQADNVLSDITYMASPMSPIMYSMSPMSPAMYPMSPVMLLSPPVVSSPIMTTTSPVTPVRILHNQKGIDVMEKLFSNNISIASKDDLSDVEEKLILKIKKDISAADTIHIDIEIKKINYEVCKCGDRMIILPNTSELKCENEMCGKVRKLYGIVFDDYQFYNQGEPKTKHGDYDFSRHFNFWMDNIQARKDKMFPLEDMNKIEYIIARDKVTDINCHQMRGVLKESNLAKYNHAIPLLIKKLTGRSPPQFTLSEMRRVAFRFNKIMEYLYVIKGPTDGNRPYYPYFIYKIIEQEFEHNQEKLNVLNYIHLQARETIIKNDLLYKSICEMANNELKDEDPKNKFMFKPTQIKRL